MIVKIILVTLLTTLSSTVSTITGFGTTTISLPILLLFFPIHQTILFIALIHWIENIWRLIFFRHGCCKKLILYFGVPAIITAAIGAKASIKMPEDILAKIIGTFLLAYAIIIFLKPKFKLNQRLITSTAGGAFSGFFAGIIGLGGAIRSAFLNAYDIAKIEYIFSTNAISFLIDSTRLPVYFSNGIKFPFFLLLSVIFFAPLSFLTAFLIRKVVIKIPQEKFRLIITIFLGLAGLRFILWQ